MMMKLPHDVIQYIIIHELAHIKRGDLFEVVPGQVFTERDEVLFVVPLPLRILKNSNLRTGPDRKYKILVIIKKGTLVSGYSYKDEWVRVKIEDGTYGWIFHTLVGGR